jgi:flagellar biosynthesis/type III secretory pathway protein FliH
MSITKKIILGSYVAIGIIIFILIVNTDNAYNKGYDYGYSIGKNEGYNEGNKVGYNRAKSEDKIEIEQSQTKVNSITNDYENKISLLNKEHNNKISLLSKDYENKIVQARREEFINGQTQMRNRIESQINTNVRNNIANNDWNAPVTSIKK